MRSPLVILTGALAASAPVSALAFAEKKVNFSISTVTYSKGKCGTRNEAGTYTPGRHAACVDFPAAKGVSFLFNKEATRRQCRITVFSDVGCVGTSSQEYPAGDVGNCHSSADLGFTPQSAQRYCGRG